MFESKVNRCSLYHLSRLFAVKRNNTILQKSYGQIILPDTSPLERTLGRLTFNVLVTYTICTMKLHTYVEY